MTPRLLPVLGAAALLLAAGCTKAPPAGPTTAALPALRVRVEHARVENVPVFTEVSGTIRPLQRAQVAARLMGTIQELPVTLGQRVRSGDLVAKIAAGEIAARVAQAQSQLNVARRDLERERALLGKGASTADTVRGLEDRLALTQAMLREAEVMLSYATIRAPFDGVVARKPANAGDLASPGMTLLEIEGTDAFQIEAPVPDSLAAGLTPGVTLAVEVPGSGLKFQAALAELSSAADPEARSVLARLTVPAGTAVRSGQYARVLLPGPPARAILVPAAALSTFGQMERIFVVGENNRAVLRLVKSGPFRGTAEPQRIEILSGLSGDERVVVAPPATLREGQPLEIAP
ncbi:MAG: efflux RND transporter periplasmic adaptor subunit [Opitutaceae bacterium]|nr:efflux RND transporter periplasmic adaptor subunit [Opitutaceae bacterium]